MSQFGILILTFIFALSCKVRSPEDMQGQSGILEAPATDTNVGQTVVDPQTTCVANGGEYISGYCVCEDGNTVKDKTCSQHIKEVYPKCFAKGGISKKWDGKDACFCEHGEMIDVNGSKTCYQLFTEKNKGCADRLGYQSVSSRACMCYHGKLTFNLPADVNCQQDFKVANPTCYAKGGVTKTADGPCICRDGSYAEGEKKCPEPWFFYAGDSSITSQPGSSSTGNKVGTGLATCMCADVTWQGRNYCMIYKPGDKYPLKYTTMDGKADCNLNHCYTHFNDTYRTECKGDVKFKPNPNTGSTAPGAKTCTCKETDYNGRACGLFQGDVRRFAIQVLGDAKCDATFCQNRWGHDAYVRQYCSSID